MNVTTAPSAVRLERTIPAPPARVYRAWLEPELVARWMNPGVFTVTRVEVDEKVGGRYRVWHAESGNERGGFDAQIVELVTNERLVFRWGFVGPQRRDGPVYNSMLTITFDETAEGTTALTLVHERLDDLAAAMPEAAANVRVGWDDVLDKLAQVLAS